MACAEAGSPNTSQFVQFDELGSVGRRPNQTAKLINAHKPPIPNPYIPKITTIKKVRVHTLGVYRNSFRLLTSLKHGQPSVCRSLALLLLAGSVGRGLMDPSQCGLLGRQFRAGGQD